MTKKATTLTLGVRREDKSIWERRVPIVPADLARLRQEESLSFLVQPSGKRVFDDEAYTKAGAEVAEEIDHAGVLFAVKEVPMELLRPEGVYVFFAHVIKGQSYNMPLLQRLLDLKATLIDYEKIVDATGKRLVLFGREAGQAGMIETFHALGRRLAWQGQDNPFQDIEQPYRYRDLDAAKTALAEAGRRLATGAWPGEGPLVVGFAGAGSVSRGAQEICQLLPHEEIRPEELEEVCRRHAGTRDRLFKVVFRKRHTVEPVDPNRPYSSEDFYRHPEAYRGRMAGYLPHLSILINAIYWQEDRPRLLTRDEASTLWRQGHRKLQVIGDLTIDIEGGIEISHKSTQPDCPTYVYDPETGQAKDGIEGPGIVVLAVDNLPCELPKEASENFSRSLFPWVGAIAQADFGLPFPALDLPAELKGAVITHRGQLTPGYVYLNEALAAAK